MTDEVGTAATGLPLAGLSVVEVAVGCSDLGLGLAGGVPGMVLADLGANVVRVVGSTEPAIDEELAWGRAWHRDKRVVRHRRPSRRFWGCSATPMSRWSTGARRSSRAGGSATRTWQPLNPSLVYARCRPSRTARGTVEDFGLLVEARRGILHAAGRSPPGPDLRRRPGVGWRGGAPAERLGAGPPAPPGAGRGRGMGRDVPLRRDALHPRLHDRALRTGAGRGRELLGEGLHLPQLPLPVRRRRADPGVVRRQGNVRQAHRGPGRRAEPGGVLPGPGDRRAQRARRRGGGRCSSARPGTSGSTSCGRPASPASRCSAPGRRSPIPIWPRRGWRSRGRRVLTATSWWPPPSRSSP